MARKIGMEFLGGKILVRGFVWALFEAQAILGGFAFCPYSIISLT